MKTTTIEHARLCRRFHALSDETRLRIIDLLSGGERCVCELTATLNAAQSRLSYHLKTLKDADLVKDRRQGRWSYYSLNADALENMAAFLGGTTPPELEWRTAGSETGLEPATSGCDCREGDEACDCAEPGMHDEFSDPTAACDCGEPETECRCV